MSAEDQETLATLKATRDEQRQLGLSVEQRFHTLERIPRRWDAIGQPPVHVA